MFIKQNNFSKFQTTVGLVVFLFRSITKSFVGERSPFAGNNLNISKSASGGICESWQHGVGGLFWPNSESEVELGYVTLSDAFGHSSRRWHNLCGEDSQLREIISASCAIRVGSSLKTGHLRREAGICLRANSIPKSSNNILKKWTKEKSNINNL